jgi:hypothetical protein
LVCQPYGGSTTSIKDYEQGQGPNVVLGLSEQYNLLPGSKIYCDNLFTSMDLLDHMGDRKIGVTGTVRMNRVIGIPLPSKKVMDKDFKRGDCQAVYTQDSMVMVWKDNQPVFMASNHEQVEPMGSCRRYSKVNKTYVDVPQPNINKEYNKNMGGVDLLDNGEKNYAITTRVKKWYWSIYVWFLNICMVQAWRLYRVHMAERHQVAERHRVAEEEEPLNTNKKELEMAKKRRRTEERKKEEISLLEFTRQVVDLLFKRHSDSASVSQLQPMLFPATLAEIRFDQGKHLIRKTEQRGVCKHCKSRTLFRCLRCNVALHAEDCFYRFHTPEDEWEEM